MERKKSRKKEDGRKDIEGKEREREYIHDKREKGRKGRRQRKIRKIMKEKNRKVREKIGKG